jgi:hypothetical protein
MVKTYKYDRTQKKQVECDALKFNYIQQPPVGGIEFDLMPLTMRDLHRLNCKSSRGAANERPAPGYNIDWQLMEAQPDLAREIWDEFNLQEMNFNMILNVANQLPFDN